MAAGIAVPGAGDPALPRNALVLRGLLVSRVRAVPGHRCRESRPPRWQPWSSASQVEAFVRGPGCTKRWGQLPTAFSPPV